MIFWLEATPLGVLAIKSTSRCASRRWIWVTCWVGAGFDYIHYHVPRAGLDEIARDHGIEPVGSYRFAQGEHDIVLAQLTQYVVPLIGSRDWTNSLMLDQFSLIRGAHNGARIGHRGARTTGRPLRRARLACHARLIPWPV